MAPAEVREVTVPASPLDSGSVASVKPNVGVEACVTAFEDQVSLYHGVEVLESGVHPLRRARFLEACETMPSSFQRCASPLYQNEHEAECEAVKAESGTPAKRTWSLVFELLSSPMLSEPPDPTR